MTSNPFTITYQTRKTIEVGDYFYRVECIGTRYLSDTCQTCDGRGFVEIKNRTFSCPACGGLIEASKTVGVIQEFATFRYCVCSTEQGIGGNPLAIVGLCRKNGFGDKEETRLTISEFAEHLNGKSGGNDITKTFYDCYELAVEKAVELNAKELEKMKDVEATPTTPDGKGVCL